MPDANKNADALLKKFLELDVKRKKDPVWGQRVAETTLMELCDLLKTSGEKLDDATRQKVLKTLQGMNLLPYRGYCREHLLDIGITNV